MHALSADQHSPITRRQALKAAGAGAGLLVGAGVLAGCGSSSSSSSAASAASGVTKLTDQLGWVKTSQWAGDFAAQTNGYFKQERLTVDLISGGPNITAAEVVAAGHANIAEDDNQTILTLIAKGQPLIIFGTITQRSPYSLISLASDPITTVKDFANKTIALPPSTRAYLDPLIKKAGVSLSSIKFVPAVNPAQLSNHEVQGYFGFATSQGVELQQQGVKVVITSNWDLGLKSYGNVLVTTKDFLSANKATLVKYLRASIKGWEYANAHPEQMGRLTVSKFAPPGDNLKAEIGQAVTQVSLIKNPGGIMKITPEAMQKVIDAMIAAKSLAKPLKASDVMTTEILDAVYGSSTSIPV